MIKSRCLLKKSWIVKSYKQVKHDSCFTVHDIVGLSITTSTGLPISHGWSRCHYSFSVVCLFWIWKIRVYIFDDDLVGSLVGIWYDPCLCYLPPVLICIEVRYSILPRHHSTTVGWNEKVSTIKNEIPRVVPKVYNQRFPTFFCWAGWAFLDFRALSLVSQWH